MIALHPNSTSAVEGTSATFTGAFVGNGKASWQSAAPGSSNVVDIPDSSSTTLVVPDLTPADSVGASDGGVQHPQLASDIYSAPATLTVTPAGRPPVADPSGAA